MPNLHLSKLSTDLAGEMGSLSGLLSVASTHCEIVACSGCPADLIRVIDSLMMNSSLAEYRVVSASRICPYST